MVPMRPDEPPLPPNPRMGPVPPTREAMEALDPTGEMDLLDRLRDRTTLVQGVVPECVAVSITLVSEDLTFTFAASDEVAATLDAAQYLDGGPCANVANDPQVREYSGEQLAENHWHLFADATAAAGIASTLTIPLRDETGLVTGSLNFYGSTAHCFDGHHEALAALFAGWAPGAVTNADMSLDAGRRAAGAPDRIRAQHRIAMAVGVMAARDDVSTEEAEEALRSAAERAGVDAGDLADAVLRAQRRKLA